MIKEVCFQGERLALIVFSSFRPDGVQFLTPGEASLQLAYMSCSAGGSIAPHVHNEVKREVTLTQEVFVVKKGSVRVSFYNDAQEFLESQLLSTGDLLLQVSGGHSFEVLEDLEMIEVKQGPYLGKEDKTYFEAQGEARATPSTTGRRRSPAAGRSLGRRVGGGSRPTGRAPGPSR